MSETNETSLFSLFISFAKIGVLTFGGGYAMLPMLEMEIADKRKWATEEELLNYYAIGQCTPGIIAVNTATAVGYKKRGVAGGIAATLGIVFPSFVLITLLAGILKKFEHNIYLLKAFAGIRISVCALILSALIKLAKKAIKGPETAIIAVLVFFLQFFAHLSPSLIVIVSVLYGLLLYFIDCKKDISDDLH